MDNTENVNIFLNEVSRDLLESVQIDAGIVSEMGYDRFIPTPFQFLINIATGLYHSTLRMGVCN